MARAGGRNLAGLALAALLAAGSAGAEEVRGPARVIDGDTLVIGRTHVRLVGIDAPEKRQRCGGAGAAGWDCGREAAARLGDLAVGEVRCSGDDRDRYDRLLAVCRVGGVDLGGRLVAEGLAWAYVRYSDAYVADEAGARVLRIGLWAGTAEAPWDYRAEAKTWTPAAGGAVAPAPGCAIKGNISGKGARLYHLPGSPNYARTRIDSARGEAWFCDEAAARAAGFAPARTR